jgi:hypothetical protein
MPIIVHPAHFSISLSPQALLRGVAAMKMAARRSAPHSMRMPQAEKRQPLGVAGLTGWGAVAMVDPFRGLQSTIRLRMYRHRPSVSIR